MRNLTAFRALSRADRRLLFDAVIASAFFRLAMPLVSLERLRAWAERSGRGGRPIERIVWAVGAATRRVPTATCLSSALTLQRLLNAHGHQSELHIGVARTEGVFAAHAWVEQDGRVLFGENERDAYVRLASWPSGTRAHQG